MEQNELTIPKEPQTGVIRLLFIADSQTVQQFYEPLRHLLFGFEAQDIHCCVVVPPDSRIESFLWPGIEIIEYPSWQFPLFYRQNRYRLISQIDKFQPTMIHCLGTGRMLLARAVSRSFNIPVVLTVNSARQSFWRRWTIRKGFSAVIAPTERIAELFKKRNSHIAERVKQVNTGIFVDETCVCFSQPGRIPSLIAVSDFLRFGDLEPFLNAIRHLSINGYEFLVVLMGEGPAQCEVRKFVQSVGLSDVVNISSQIGQLRAVFRNVDVFVQPNVLERFDPAIFEAAGAGAAIAADKGNADGLLQDNITAILFDKRDELSICSALQKLLDDREKAKSLASAAQNYLRTSHSVSSMVENLLKIYTEAIETKKHKTD
ncbi:MAG: glycosyltransferase family 4 protein [Sedimentisphaerales bacterium]